MIAIYITMDHLLYSDRDDNKTVCKYTDMIISLPHFLYKDILNILTVNYIPLINLINVVSYKWTITTS